MEEKEQIACPNCGKDDLPEPYRFTDLHGYIVEHYECPECNWKWNIR